MKYEIIDSLSWLYTDSIVNDAGKKKASLISPMGGRPGFQVILDGASEDDAVAFGCNGLTNLQGGRIEEVKACLLHSVPVEYNTGVDGFTDRNRPTAPDLARKAPFRVFDAMAPVVEQTRIWIEEPAAFFIQVVVPRDAVPGDYSGEAVISVGSRTVSVPISLHVFSVILPEQYPLSLTTHYSLDSMAGYHDLIPDSPGHWNMILTYARLLADYHHDTFIVPQFAEVKQQPDGKLEFDFRKTERFIRIFLDAGFTRIEGTHLGGCERWGGAEIFLNDPRYPAQHRHRLSSPEAQNFLSRYLTAWRMFLDRRGWYTMLCQHVGDEPTDEALVDFLAGALAIRKYLPGVPILEPIETPNLGSAIDWWIPKLDDYERDREIYETHRSHGDQIWCYTCCKPGGQYMNRLLDQPLLALRLIPWGCAKYGIKGYLHWALNIWRETSPYEASVYTQKTAQPDGTFNDLPAGDTHIIYPGSKEPWSSVRFEAQREGWEDHALLMQAKDKLGSDKFDALLEKTVRGFADFTRKPEEFRREYAALLKTCVL